MFDNMVSAFGPSIYFSRDAMIICVASSAQLPRAMYKKFLYSLLCILVNPSAILEGIDTAERLN